MELSMSPDMAAISLQFCVAGRLISIEPYGNGHINDTYLATYDDGGRPERVIHQRINQAVFADPPAVMYNIQRTTRHLFSKLAIGGSKDDLQCTLCVVTTRTKEPILRTDNGEYWRSYRFVEGTHTFEYVEAPEQAYRAARAFGRFQALLADLPEPPLVETISGFHDTPRRWTNFERALDEAAGGRVDAARDQIAFATAQRELGTTLVRLYDEQLVPERITHNDTKLNNVLFDIKTGQAVCVVDLDTVMPGLSLYDFGDMVRTMTCTAAEDERDLSRVHVDPRLFAAVARGYIESTAGMLNEVEHAHLVAAGMTIVFEQGLRFLTDYLAGDAYYKVHRSQHNLDRCRSQFALLKSILAQEVELTNLATRFVKGRG
jgi:hypothetical protein